MDLGVTDFSYKNWIDQLRILRVNRANLTPEQIKGKYKKAYEKQRHTVKVISDKILADTVCGGLRILKNEQNDPAEAALQEKLTQEIQRIIDAAQQAGVMKQLGRIIFLEHISPAGKTSEAETKPYAEKAADEFLNLVCEKIGQPVWYRAYGPYWAAHCRKDPETGAWFNEITGFWWDESCHVWIRQGDDGKFWFQTMLPPTLELIDEEARKDGY